MNRTWIVCLFATLTLAGCGSSTPPRPREQPRFNVRLVDLPLHRPEQADRAALPGVVKSSNTFALDVYHKLQAGPGNLLVAPACLTAGLGMLRAGARGETAAELDRVLHRPGMLDDRALAALVQDLNADGEERSFQIRLANAVWVQKDKPILDDYRAALRAVFALDDDRRVDFTGRPAEAARVINAWAAQRTGGKITGVIGPEAVAFPTKLALTSALYLRGNWDAGFYRPLTKDEPFHLTRSRSIQVPTMRMVGEAGIAGYCDGGSFQVVSLSLGRDAYAMDIFFPREVEGLPSLEASLTAGAVEALLPKLKTPALTLITLPRFRLRSSRELKPLLEELGLSRTFVMEQADFSGINGQSADLFVTAVTHETFLDVNEEGLEAAAFMGVIGADSDGGGGSPPKFLSVDHPFLFLIRNTRTGCIVFMGRVVNPVEP